jgi:hypothetical protein
VTCSVSKIDLFLQKEDCTCIEMPPNKAVKSLEGILKTSHKADKEFNKPWSIRH